MARPFKRGLDYFPLDVDMENDSAVCLIEAKHGSEGFTVLVKLLMRVYRDEGYFLRWNERERFVFARQVGIDHEKVEAVVTDCLTEGLFDLKTYQKHDILTSKGIQSRYMLAVKRRAGVEIRKEFLLAPKVAAELGIKVCVTETEDSAAETTQRKEKEIEIEKGEKREIVAAVVAHLNAAAGTKFKPTGDKTKTHILARLNEGFVLEDFKTVIDVKTADWLHDVNMSKYLRPETLFGRKFEGYLNEKKTEGGERRVSGDFRSADELFCNQN